jgi:hypothetical protein
MFKLSKTAGPTVNYMAKQTRKAVLLFLMDNGEQVSYWFPKSQLQLTNMEHGFVVRVTDWAWENRKPAKAMGCL